MEEKLNIKTPYGTLVGSQTYGSTGYGDWIVGIADRFVKADILDNITENYTFDDYIYFLESEVEKTEDPQDKEKLGDLVVAIKMTAAGKDFENFPPSVTPTEYYRSWIYALYFARGRQDEKQKLTSVRGLNHDLYMKARFKAAVEGKNIGEWLNELIGDKLAQAEIEQAERKKRRIE